MAQDSKKTRSSKESTTLSLREAFFDVSEQIGTERHAAEVLLEALADGRLPANGLVCRNISSDVGFLPGSFRSTHGNWEHLGREWWLVDPFWYYSHTKRETSTYVYSVAHQIVVSRGVLCREFPRKVVRVAGSVRARTLCLKWLRYLVENWGDALPLKKAEVFELSRSLELCGPRLSKRSFEQAWSQTVPESWRTPGRRPGTPAPTLLNDLAQKWPESLR